MSAVEVSSELEAADAEWATLYRVGGVAAIISAVFVPIQIAVFVVSPPPSTAAGWFALFQRSWLLGLLDMDLLLLADQVLMGLILLALYFALRRANRSLMTLALASGMVSIATYFASGRAFEMLALGNQYAAATTAAQKAAVLAAGQVAVLGWMGTAFDVSYLLEAAALLLVGLVMLRSKVFGRVTAWVAVALGVLSLLPPTAGTPGLVMSLASLVPLEIWYLLVGLRLFQLARGVSAEEVQPGAGRVSIDRSSSSVVA